MSYPSTGPNCTTQVGLKNTVCVPCRDKGIGARVIKAVTERKDLRDVDVYELLLEQCRLISEEQASFVAARDASELGFAEAKKAIDSLSRALSSVAKELRGFEELRAEQADALDFAGAADVIVAWFKARPPEQQRDLLARFQGALH